MPPSYNAIPENSKYLDFPRSDGRPDRWPVDKLDPTPDANGEVNYMRPVAHDEPLCIKWRMQIGREVAKLLGHPDHKKYVLKHFPEGYKFYHHNKGSVHDPRTDPYLYGAQLGRYRSPPEFIRHAYWLITDDTLSRKNCGCKYCTSSKTQKEISQDLGLKTVPVAGSSATYAKPKVRQVAQPRKLQSAAGTAVNHDRTLDLRSSRRYRQGELVWCALDPVIQGGHQDERIEFWPGLVNETRLKNDVLPHEPGAPWRVLQSTVYKVKLLGVMNSYVLPEGAILPYQAYGPSIDLIERLRLAGDPALLQESQRLAELRPIPMGVEPEDHLQLRFVEAATPFALAIQIAAHLVRMWTPSDEWKFHGELPPPSSASASGSANGPAPAQITEARHQGLWWGAERIWVDELVRLQPGRSQVVPQGSQIIYRASPRADGRGVLMRINSILAVPEGAAKDAPRECKVAGVLYELADETYEEKPLPESIPQKSPVPDSAPSTSSAPLITNGSVAPADTLIIPENDVGALEPSAAPLENGAESLVNGAPALAKSAEPSEKAAEPSEKKAEPVGNATGLSANAARRTESATPPSHSPGFLPPKTPINLPNLPPYPLPKPPFGYKFRSIMKPGYEIVLDVSLIAGRYYPDLLSHSLLKDTLADTNLDETRVPQLSALCGLLAGAVNSMECVDWAGTRLAMIKLADVKAQQDLFQHWHASPWDHEDAKNTNDPDVEMKDMRQHADVEMQDVQV